MFLGMTPEDVWTVNNQGSIATVYGTNNKESAIAYARDLAHQATDTTPHLNTVEPAHPNDDGKYVFRLRDTNDEVAGYVTATKRSVTTEPYSPDYPRAE